MANPANQKEAVLRENSSLIHLVIMALAAPDIQPQLEQQLKLAEENGWTDLVRSVRKIISGERDINALSDLDEEDRIVVESILNGIGDPATLPDLSSAIDPNAAAPAIAKLVNDVNSGSSEAQKFLDKTIQQLSEAGLASEAERLKNIVSGERNAHQLCEGLGDTGATLLRRVLEELAQLEA